MQERKGFCNIAGIFLRLGEIERARMRRVRGYRCSDSVSSQWSPERLQRNEP